MTNEEKIVADIFEVIAPVLFHEVESEHMLIIDLDDEDMEGEEGDAQAYCGYVDTEIHGGLKFRSYTIAYKKELLKDPMTFKRMVCHELVHVMQTERGDEFNHDLPYFEQPHEIEAYDLENWLLYYYNLKGKY